MQASLSGCANIAATTDLGRFSGSSCWPWFREMVDYARNMGQRRNQGPTCLAHTGAGARGHWQPACLGQTGAAKRVVACIAHAVARW